MMLLFIGQIGGLPANMTSFTCPVPSQEFPKSATLFGNHTSIASCLDHVRDQFSAMFERKAFLHWYTGEGL